MLLKVPDCTSKIFEPEESRVDRSALSETKAFVNLNVNQDFSKHVTRNTN